MSKANKGLNLDAVISASHVKHRLNFVHTCMRNIYACANVSVCDKFANATMIQRMGVDPLYINLLLYQHGQWIYVEIKRFRKHNCSEFMNKPQNCKLTFQFCLHHIFFQGKLKYNEHIFNGFDKMPEAFLGLFTGENTGKAIIKI